MQMRKINPVREIIREANEKIYWKGEEVDVFSLFSVIRNRETNPYVTTSYRMTGFSILIKEDKDGKDTTSRLMGHGYNRPMSVHGFVHVLVNNGFLPTMMELLASDDVEWYDPVDVNLKEDGYIFNLRKTNDKYHKFIKGLKYDPRSKHDKIEEGSIYCILGEKDIRSEDFSSVHWGKERSTYTLYFVKEGRLYIFMGSRVPSEFNLWSGQILLHKNWDMRKEMTKEILNEDNGMYYFRLDPKTYLLINSFNGRDYRDDLDHSVSHLGLILKTDSEAFKEGFDFSEEHFLAEEIKDKHFDAIPIGFRGLTISKTEDKGYKMGVLYEELTIEYEDGDDFYYFDFDYNKNNPTKYHEVESIAFRKIEKIEDQFDFMNLKMVHPKNWEENKVEMLFPQTILQDIFEGQINKIKNYLRSVSYLPISYLTETIMAKDGKFNPGTLSGNFKDYITHCSFKVNGNKILHFNEEGDECSIEPMVEVDQMLFQPSEKHLACSKSLTPEILKDYVSVFGLLMPFKYFESISLDGV